MGTYRSVAVSAEIRAHEFDVLLSNLKIRKPGDGFTVVPAMRTALPLCDHSINRVPGLWSASQALQDKVDNYFVKPADVEQHIGNLRA